MNIIPLINDFSDKFNEIFKILLMINLNILSLERIIIMLKKQFKEL